ncbi:hypothetical protein JOB18_033261, partial [Solea senegalensis]
CFGSGSSVTGVISKSEAVRNYAPTTAALKMQSGNQALISGGELRKYTITSDWINQRSFTFIVTLTHTHRSSAHRERDTPFSRLCCRLCGQRGCCRSCD